MERKVKQNWNEMRARLCEQADRTAAHYFFLELIFIALWEEIDQERRKKKRSSMSRIMGWVMVQRVTGTREGWRFVWEGCRLDVRWNCWTTDTLEERESKKLKG